MLVREIAPETTLHTPVMVEEVLHYLDVLPGGRYVDCTVGTGGHAEAVLEMASPGGLLLGLDVDAQALALARKRLERFWPDVRLVEANYRDLAAVCREYSFIPVHGVLFDLGLSSLQLAQAERGFSFQREGPLDMRFDQEQELTAFDIVNHCSEVELARIIWQYGEERQSRRIARAIVRARPIHTTRELAEVVSRAVRAPGHRLHPATRTFQALRIAVNRELENLEMALAQAVQVLGRGGRLVVISYHSLEDRIVKQFLQRESQDCICPPDLPKCLCGHRATLRPLTRSPVRPSDDEVRRNPRSRSALLRAAEKL
ncbi:Ribosomal RNA small subunit methyltransferase H [bacterium HR25]|jgi:16S rRNA (cytosine1402-N4)-methyltransferase|nr:Ribosomal RNA small subunit methyltransferase H [bacterium HR25]